MTAVPKADYIAAMFDHSTLRLYDEIVRTAKVSSVAALASGYRAAVTDVRAALRRLHDAHMLVLQPSGEMLMANPFSAVPKPFVTEVGGRRWFGNCIWDVLGILATVGANGRVLTSCDCCGDAMESAVHLSSTARPLLRGRFSLH